MIRLNCCLKSDLTISILNLISCPSVIVATFSGSSYYKITSTLNSINLNFIFLFSEEEAALCNAKSQFTTITTTIIVIAVIVIAKPFSA